MKKVGIIVFLILLIDQTLKIWIKTTMYLGEDIHVFGDWFIIHFTENNGMAFGWELGGKSGKYLLSVFRIIAIGGIGYYIWFAWKRNAKTGLLIALSLIFAGATGNIIDSAFYGLIFSESGNYISQIPAEIFPESGGYGSFLQGKVVDMFYFPVIESSFPDWLFGGRDFIFFRPVFNFADTSITIGVFMLLLFNKRYFKQDGHGIRPAKDPEFSSQDIDQEQEASNTTV